MNILQLSVNIENAVASSIAGNFACESQENEEEMAIYVKKKEGCFYRVLWIRIY